MLNNSIKNKGLYIWDNYKPLLILIVCCIVIGLWFPQFRTFGNISTIFKQTSINAVIATGMTFAILIGGIDLSVGSVLAISGAIGATLISTGVNPVLAILLTLIIGLGFGLINGLLISKGRLQAFIATLGVMTLLRGCTYVYTGGKPISIYPAKDAVNYEAVKSNGDFFSSIGTGHFLGIPIPIYIMVLVFIVAYYILNHTRTGRYVYALGSNEEATVYSGIKVDRIKLFVYGISGTLAALSGIIVTARLGSAGPTAGSGYELDAIAAVVLGGTSMAGGVGRISGTLIGALIIGVLSNALNLTGVSSYYQDIVKGVVILIAVLMDRKQKVSR